MSKVVLYLTNESGQEELVIQGKDSLHMVSSELVKTLLGKKEYRYPDEVYKEEFV